MQNIATNELIYDVFDRDALDIKAYATNIVNIIRTCDTFPKNNDNKAYVIGINASWGSGKTYFDELLIDFFSQNKDNLRINTVYYDAWANDFWDNAFEPFFAQMISCKVLEREVLQSDSSDILKSAAKIIALGIKGFAYKKIEDIFSSGTMDEIITEGEKMWDNASDEAYQVKNYFKEYYNFTKAISVLRSFLQNSVTKSGGKIVIFIDELDRCKPTYAIQTLEIVKHLFNIEGLVFVFSLDLEQLSYCVQTVYGEKIDAIGYLERFFNFITALPRLDYTKITKQYIAEFKILHHNRKFIQSVNDISSLYNLSLRDLRTVLSSLFVLQQTSLEKYQTNDDATILYLYFLTMKYKYPSMLNKAVFGQSIELLEDFLSNHPIPFLFDKVSINTALLNKTIGDNMYQLVIQTYDKYNWQANMRFSFNHDKVTLIDMNATSHIIQPNESLNFLLYSDDMSRLSDVQNLRVIDYIYKNLELSGSVNE